MADNQQPPDVLDLTDTEPIPSSYDALTRDLGIELQDYASPTPTNPDVLDLTDTEPIPSSYDALTRDLGIELQDYASPTPTNHDGLKRKKRKKNGSN